MSSLIDIQNQIAELQARAQEIKTREFNEKVAMIKETMLAYGISVEDLQGKSAKETKAKSSSPAPAKYTGPNGESWSGVSDCQVSSLSTHHKRGELAPFVFPDLIRRLSTTPN